MNAVDTNILIYVRDPRDPEKQRKAIAICGGLEHPVLLWQVACEYLAASRKLEPLGFSSEEAWRDIQDFQDLWQLALPTWQVLQQGRKLREKYSLSFWDANLIAACLDAGVTQMYTEDFSAYPYINGIRVVNPFR